MHNLKLATSFHTEILNQGQGEDSQPMEFAQLLHTLSEEDVAGLPPGGGLSAK